MSDPSQRRDDPIHDLFRKLREGFSDIVVNLVGRVDQRIQLFIEDERHQSPDADTIATDALKDVGNVFSSLIPTQKSGHTSAELLDTDPDHDL